MIPNFVQRIVEQVGLWASTTTLARWINNWEWAVPIFTVTHVFGLILLIGSAFVIALRCFGLALRRDSASAIIRAFSPATLGGLLLSTVSGALIFTGGPANYVHHRYFLLKMMTYTAALVTQLTVWGMALRDDGGERLVSPKWMVMGGLAFVLWVTVAVFGRSIAFFG